MKRIFNLNKKIRNFPQKFARPLVLALYISLSTIGIHQLGIIQTLEFVNYDLLFYLKQPEAIDERITIVKWDEKSINALQESIISDINLNKLVNKILQYNPRVIGLNLYRDIPVSSSKLSQEENFRAYNSLNQTFKVNSNIIGIQKIVLPKIRPSPVLEREGRAAAADISPDRDVRVRKVYIFPNVDEDGKPTEVPYVGVALAYQYLARDNWLANNIPNGLKIHKNEKSVILKPLANTLISNNLYKEDSRWKFFLNWRKTRANNNFNSISVTDIFNKPSNLNSLFRDRLVLIGNVTSYSGDIHRTALDRWPKKPSSSDSWQEEQLTNGVEIVAQVSSSIISNALDNRNLINPAPLWLVYILVILPLFSLAKICENSINTNASLTQLRWKTFCYGVLFIVSLAIFGIFGFKVFGVWISITPSMIGIIMGWIIYNSFSQSQKEKRDFHYLKLLMKDFKHNIRGVSRQIASANRAIYRNNNAIARKITDNLSFFDEHQTKFLENLLEQNINSITLRNRAIDTSITRINRYQERTTNFLNYTYSNAIHNTEICDLNFKIQEFIDHFVSEQRTEYTYSIEPSYDVLIAPQKVNIDDWLIILDNLLSNALYAINPELNTHKNFNPKIKILTFNTPKNIRLIVEDNGIGIPEEIQQKIFFPFVSFKEGRGDGMGLHLVSQIVNCRQGKLILESHATTGTKFIIELPKIY